MWLHNRSSWQRHKLVFFTRYLKLSAVSDTWLIQYCVCVKEMAIEKKRPTNTYVHTHINLLLLAVRILHGHTHTHISMYLLYY